MGKEDKYINYEKRVLNLKLSNKILSKSFKKLLIEMSSPNAFLFLLFKINSKIKLDYFLYN